MGVSVGMGLLSKMIALPLTGSKFPRHKIIFRDVLDILLYCQPSFDGSAVAFQVCCAASLPLLKAWHLHPIVQFQLPSSKSWELHSILSSTSKYLDTLLYIQLEPDLILNLSYSPI